MRFKTNDKRISFLGVGEKSKNSKKNLKKKRKSTKHLQKERKKAMGIRNERKNEWKKEREKARNK